MDLNTLQSWLWRAACTIRGEVDAARYKDYILPLIFYKRLDDVYAEELAGLAQAWGMSAAEAEPFLAEQREMARIYIPARARWAAVRRTAAGLGETITDALNAIAKENDELQGVINRRDFNATDQGQRILEDDTLARLVDVLSQHPLGLADVQPDLLGRAYEYLLRKFAERGASAGEFFTPTEVGYLIAHILDPQPGETIYDPAAGSLGLLIKMQLRHRAKLAAALGKEPAALAAGDDPRPIQLYAQELQGDNVAAAKMNAFLHDMQAEVRQGNTLRDPVYLDADGSLRRFHKNATNPMWNQTVPTEIYDNDRYDRFICGAPPGSSADWGWVQHMYASLRPGGRMACVLDTGAASRGSGNQGANRERDIRRAFVEAGAVEAVLLLPENLFFNTSAPGIILVARRPDPAQPQPHGDILLINGSKHFEKGRPKNSMSMAQVAELGDIFLQRRAVEGVSVCAPLAEIARNDYNLSPSRYVAGAEAEPPLPLDEALALLREAEEARAAADAKLAQVLAALGLG